MTVNRDYLFELLEDNFKKYYPKGKTFWRELHALDNELERGYISVAPAATAPATDLNTGRDSSHKFQGVDVLTIQMKSDESAKHAAHLLGDIMEGCGTEFIAESYQEAGQTRYRVRSNIDKAHWDKLCVFCTYRFHKEIPEDQKEKLFGECQQIISSYTKGTDCEDWKAVDGVPAICTLMGLHGNLRPKHRYRADADRKQHEINDHHPRGTPLAFNGVEVHVEVQKDGSLMTMPYKIGFDPGRVAERDATGGEPYWGLLLETFGGNPFAKHLPLSRRVIFSVGLALGAYGAATGGEHLLGWIAPATAAAGAGAFIVATYVDHKWKIIDRIDGIRKGSKEQKEIEAAVNSEFKRRGMNITMPIEDLPPDSAITEAYTRGGGGHVHEEHPREPDVLGLHTARALRVMAGRGEDMESVSATTSAGRRT